MSFPELPTLSSEHAQQVIDAELEHSGIYRSIYRKDGDSVNRLLGVQQLGSGVLVVYERRPKDYVIHVFATDENLAGDVHRDIDDVFFNFVLLPNGENSKHAHVCWIVRNDNDLPWTVESLRRIFPALEDPRLSVNEVFDTLDFAPISASPVA